MSNRKLQYAVVLWTIVLIGLVVGSSMADIIIGGVTLTTGKVTVDTDGQMQIDSDPGSTIPIDIKIDGIEAFLIFKDGSFDIKQTFLDGTAAAVECLHHNVTEDVGSCRGIGKPGRSIPGNFFGTFFESWVPTADKGSSSNVGWYYVNEALDGTKITGGDILRYDNGRVAQDGFIAFRIDAIGDAFLSAGQIATLADIDATDIMVSWDKPEEDATNGSTFDEHVFYHTSTTVTVNSIGFVPDVASVVLNDTNFKTVTVSKRNSAGAGKVTVGTINTTTSGPTWTDFNFVDFGTLTNTSMLADEILTFEITTTGNGGTKIPAGVLIVDITP